MANDFEVISEEYEQIKSTNDKEEILSYIQNSKITKNTYLSMETYLRKEKINTDLLNIFQ